MTITSFTHDRDRNPDQNRVLLCLTGPRQQLSLADKAVNLKGLRMFAFRVASLCIFLLAGVSPAYADTKILTSEASYIMGDGETPSFAEVMALQKAKQLALEEAGTYVQSYTMSLNQDLNRDEILTLAGGVMHVEVLEKSRTLVAEGLRVYTKIRATVTTDKVVELARRIKGQDVVHEYRQLQMEHVRLSRELENLKQRVARTSPGAERDVVLDRIEAEANAFVRVQRQEADLFQGLVSGQRLITGVRRDKEIIDDLLQTIRTSGFHVNVGDIRAVAVAGKNERVAVKVPITIRISHALYEAVHQAVKLLDGVVRGDVKVWFPHDIGDPQLLRIGGVARSEATVTLVRLARYLETASFFQEKIMDLAMLVTFEGTKMLSGQEGRLHNREPFRCYLGGKSSWQGMGSLEHIMLGYSDEDWYPLRRIFPVAEVFGNPPLYPNPRIDNGWFDKTLACRNAEATGHGCRIGEPPIAVNDRQDLPTRDGYVAIVQDDVSFVATKEFHQDIVSEMTGVSVQVVPDDELPGYILHCGLAY
jgi:hypothetical protein